MLADTASRPGRSFLFGNMLGVFCAVYFDHGNEWHDFSITMFFDNILTMKTVNRGPANQYDRLFLDEKCTVGIAKPFH